MDSNSDSTIDSDELKEFISESRKNSQKNSKSPNTKNRKRAATSHAVSESDSDNDESPKKKRKSQEKEDSRPKCQYGSMCYRKNPEHLKQFSHPRKQDTNVGGAAPSPVKGNTPSKCKQDSKVSDVAPSPVKGNTPSKCNNYQFFVTKVHGISEKYNKLAMDIKDILSLKDGTLISSVQFNYMFDIPWLVQQYPEKYRNCPITIVHGEKRDSKKTLENSGASYPNIKFCQAKLEIPFGTHHTKMMFLLYKEGLRIVIHTSNIVDSDWFQKTQGMWISPILPQLKNPSESGESPTNFKADMIEYISAYGLPALQEWCETIKKHDFSKVRVILIGSVPGRHLGSKKTCFGHLKMRKVLNLHCSSADVVKTNWPLVCQFSSIGSMGTSADLWLTGEFALSLATAKGSSICSQSNILKLVYPSVENVRLSLQGYPAGASLPYSYKVAQKQPYLKKFMHQWKSDKLGRSEASPHIKTYFRVSPDNVNLAWFLLTSSNLSKAAWGSLEKKGQQFMIRSYELGVLFLPKFFNMDTFYISPPSTCQSINKIFPLPYDVPLKPYSQNDEPWIWDIPQIRAPDRFGNKWCPP